MRGASLELGGLGWGLQQAVALVEQRLVACHLSLVAVVEGEEREFGLGEGFLEVRSQMLGAEMLGSEITRGVDHRVSGPDRARDEFCGRGTSPVNSAARRPRRAREPVRPSW